MTPIDIFMTSWLRPEFTQRSIEHIVDRTTTGTYKIHVLDNQSSVRTRDPLLRMLDSGVISSVTLHSQNTRCLWGKAVFHAMVPSASPYYVVTDNDVLPPKLEGKDWLQRMVDIMDAKEEIAFLTPQLPPTWLQEPFAADESVVYCKAVGNTFKMVRREAYPEGRYEQSMEKFGDDGMVSQLSRESGWKVAFCRDIFCLHLGQTDNWGYESEEIAMDPRKAGYGPPFRYTPEDTNTFRPPAEHIFTVRN